MQETSGTTYRDVVTFLNIAGPRLAKPDQRKFTYALRKMVKQCAALWTTYTEQVEDLNIEHCAVDKAGVILKGEIDGYAFTKDGLQKRNAARRTLFESVVAVTPFLAHDVPPDLTDAEREAFAGFVLLDVVDDEPVGVSVDAKPRRIRA